MFDLLLIGLLYAGAYYIPKITLLCLILGYVTLFFVYYCYNNNPTILQDDTIAIIKQDSHKSYFTNVIVTMMSFGFAYYSSLLAGNFEHTVTQQYMMAIASILLGMVYTIRPTAR